MREYSTHALRNRRPSRAYEFGIPARVDLHLVSKNPTDWHFLEMRGESMRMKPSIPISILVFSRGQFRNGTRPAEGHSRGQSLSRGLGPRWHRADIFPVLISLGSQIQTTNLREGRESGGGWRPQLLYKSYYGFWPCGNSDR